MKIPSCIDSLKLRQEIEYMATFIATEKMPEEISRLIKLIKLDLNEGPVYLNEENEIDSCFAGNVKPFQYKKSCEIVRDWLDENVNCIQYEYTFDDETGESEWETAEDSDREIKKMILGVAYQYLY